MPENLTIKKERSKQRKNIQVKDHPEEKIDVTQTTSSLSSAYRPLSCSFVKTRSIRTDSILFPWYTEVDGWALPRAALSRSYELRRVSMNTPREGARVAAVPKKAEGKP